MALDWLCFASLKSLSPDGKPCRTPVLFVCIGVHSWFLIFLIECLRLTRDISVEPRMDTNKPSAAQPQPNQEYHGRIMGGRMIAGPGSRSVLPHIISATHDSAFPNDCSNPRSPQASSAMTEAVARPESCQEN